MRYGTPCFEGFCDYYGIGKRQPSTQFYLSDYKEVVFLDADLQHYSVIWSASWNTAAKFYNSFKLGG